MTLTTLPTEIQFNILFRLNERDFASVASTCKQFKAFSTDPHNKFPRITSKVHQNILEGKYFLTQIPLNQQIRIQDVLCIENGNPVFKEINKTQKIDERTVYTVHNNYIYKDVKIGETNVDSRAGSLYVGNEIISINVLDFANLNGNLIYSTIHGLFCYSLATLKSERITKKVYSQIAADENEGIICGLAESHIDKLDFNHPEAKIREEERTLSLIKAKILKVAITFFKEIKNYIVDNFEWNSALIVVGIGCVLGLGFGILLSTTLAEVLAFTGLFILIESIVSLTFVTLEILKHAVIKAATVALEPL